MISMFTVKFTFIPRPYVVRLFDMDQASSKMPRSVSLGLGIAERLPKVIC